MKKTIAFISALLLAPSFVFAQQMITDFNGVTAKATNIGNTIIGIFISFAVLYIIYGVVRYLIAGGEDDRKTAGMNILYGVIGLFVILSIWGLVAILRNTFRTQDNIPINEINRTTTLPLPGQI